MVAIGYRTWEPCFLCRVLYSEAKGLELNELLMVRVS